MTERVHGDVMLVGSMPFDDAATALRKSGEALTGHAGFWPDGEVCGYGRVDPSELDHVLAVHAACADALSSTP